MAKKRSLRKHGRLGPLTFEHFLCQLPVDDRQLTGTFRFLFGDRRGRFLKPVAAASLLNRLGLGVLQLFAKLRHSVPRRTRDFKFLHPVD